MNLLLVEDEARVADFLRRGLKAEGWTVEHAPDGECALQAMAAGHFDVVLLDLMLPGISGQDVCRRLRARGDRTPILMLTALDGTEACVAGLRMGADDYLTKPFDFEELLARIEALHRRQRQAETGEDAGDDGIRFDADGLRIFVDGAEVDLSVKEREMMVLFLANPDRALSRERILNAVWGIQEDPLTNVVDVYVGRLRRKIAPYGGRIATLRGAGYRYDSRKGKNS
ncbi:response regulator transcription factor [Paracoccus sp. (in: a-proteobacteria)]|uniref:response regulator transcription factor n=1 Tax=Paracoccus sp. TaxID=267 RepID=UPI00322057AA